MAAPLPGRADRVCETCKLKKRACDKAVPRCGFCEKRGYTCSYVEGIQNTANTSLSNNTGPHMLIGTLSIDSTVNSQVQTILRSLGLDAQKVKADYFANFHPSFPIVSPTLHLQHLSSRSGQIRADHGVLVLAMLLVSYDLPNGDVLCSVLRKMLLEVQESRELTLAYVQTQLLVAVFEYARGWTRRAYVSVGICIRQSCLLGLDVWEDDHRYPEAENNESSFRREAWNTWWGVMIVESVVLSELDDLRGRQSASFPDDCEFLPVDMSPSATEKQEAPAPVRLTKTEAIGVSSFGRLAQAGFFLNRVLQLVQNSNHSKPWLRSVRALDEQVKDFLTLIMREQPDSHRSEQAAVTIAVRSLFLLHEMFTETSDFDEQDLQWSKETLDTIVVILTDVAHVHTLEETSLHPLPLGCVANMISARRHLDHSLLGSPANRSRNFLDDLEVIFCTRWRCGVRL